MHATCHTQACTNQGVPITVPDDAELVICGVCGEPIEDVSTNAPTLPTEVPQWLS